MGDVLSKVVLLAKRCRVHQHEQPQKRDCYRDRQLMVSAVRGSARGMAHHTTLLPRLFRMIHHHDMCTVLIGVFLVLLEWMEKDASYVVVAERLWALSTKTGVFL